MKRLDYTGFRKDAFDTWSSEMAYWLGFFAADGNVPENSNYINITLNYNDRDHLVKFKNFLGLQDCFLRDTYTTVKGKRFTQARLSFSSKYVKKRLISLGIVPSKSQYDIDFTKYVPFEFMTPFLLGYFDGDGSYSGINSKTQNLGIVYCGSYSFITSVRDYFSSVYYFNTSTVYSSNDALHYVYWGRVKDVVRFADIHLNTLGNTPLNRKLQNAREIISGEAYDSCRNCDKVITKGTKTKLCSKCQSVTTRKTNRPDKETLKKLIQQKGYSATGRMFGVSDNAVRKWAKKYGLI